MSATTRAPLVLNGHHKGERHAKTRGGFLKLPDKSRPSVKAYSPGLGVHNSGMVRTHRYALTSLAAGGNSCQDVYWFWVESGRVPLDGGLSLMRLIEELLP